MRAPARGDARFAGLRPAVPARCALGGGGEEAGGAPEETAATLLAEPVAFTTDGDHVTVMEQPIEDGAGHHVVTEDPPPLSHRPVRGHQEAAALVAPVDELEEQMRGVDFERQISEFVHIRSFGFV